MSVLAAGNRDELLAEVVGFTKRLGFEMVSAMTVIDHFRAESEFITIDNTPAAYRKAFADFNSGRRDPVMQPPVDRPHSLQGCPEDPGKARLVIDQDAHLSPHLKRFVRFGSLGRPQVALNYPYQLGFRR